MVRYLEQRKVENLVEQKGILKVDSLVVRKVECMAVSMGSC